MTRVSFFKIQHIGYVWIDSSTPRLSLYITYTTNDEQGVTISNYDLDCQGRPLRSCEKL